MRSFDKFKWKMNLNGGSLRNENIMNSKRLLEQTFFDDPSFAMGIYFWELGLKSYDGRNFLPVRLYGRKFSAANGVTMQFQTLIDSPVFVGDIVYDSKTDEHWICTEVFNINDIHWQGKFTLCNWILKWQDKNGVILEYPCYDMNSTQYNSGEESNKQFTIGSSQHMLTLPYDKNTVVLKSPQRFFLDKDLDNPTSYMVTQNDTTSYSFGKKGLVKVTVFECATNNATDRIDLGICDYVSKDDIKKDNKPDVCKHIVSKSVIAYDTKVIKSGGDSQVFVGNFFDDNGKEVENVVPRWNIICDFVDSLQIERADNYIRIGINDDTYVDEDFKIILTDSEGKYPSSLIVSVESLL